MAEDMLTKPGKWPNENLEVLGVSELGMGPKAYIYDPSNNILTECFTNRNGYFCDQIANGLPGVGANGQTESYKLAVNATRLIAVSDLGNIYVCDLRNGCFKIHQMP